MSVAPDFRSQLAAHDLPHLERSGSLVYALRPDLTLAYGNPAWEAATGPLRPGALSWIPEERRSWFRTVFERVLRTREQEAHEIRCEDPDGAVQHYQMRALPLRDGLLVVNHQVVEDAPEDTHYDGIDGFATQCCQCRATRRVDRPDTWDWVPGYLDTRRPDVSHGLCPVCFAHYFPEAAARRARQGSPPRREPIGGSRAPG